MSTDGHRARELDLLVQDIVDLKAKMRAVLKQDDIDIMAAHPRRSAPTTPEW